MFVENGYEFYRDCSNGCRTKQIKALRSNYADIPEAYAKDRISTFNAGVYQELDSKNKILGALKIIHDWLTNLDACQEKGMGLYLYSNTKGSGKTKMVASIANELLGDDCNRIVKFATSLQVLNEIRASWDSNTDYSESKLIDELIRAEFLIIDDFGTEKAKDWVNERVYSIINERYINKRPTLFTSNYKITDLPYDDRITSRIEEMVIELPFPEESIRSKIASKRKAQIEERLNNGKQATN